MLIADSDTVCFNLFGKQFGNVIGTKKLFMTSK